MYCLKRNFVVFILIVTGISGALASRTVKIGLILPLSGSLASYGKAVLAGVRLSEAQTNGRGGFNGKRIQLFVQDNRGKKDETIKAFNNLARNRVVAIIGPLTSDNAIVLRQLAKTHKLPLITPTATNDKVTQNNLYVFRTCFNDSFQGYVIANYIYNNMKLSNAAIFKDLSSDYSRGLCNSFKDTFNAIGGRITAEESYQSKDNDFKIQLRNIKASRAEAIFLPGYPPEVPKIIRQAKEMKLVLVFCGAEGWDNDVVINGSGPNIEGSIIVSAFSKDDKRKNVTEFIQDFNRVYRSDPGTFEALGYDTFSLLGQAIKGCGNNPNRKAIKNKLYEVKDYQGVTGIVSMDSSGDVRKSAVIMMIVKSGNKYIKKYKTTILP